MITPAMHIADGWALVPVYPMRDGRCTCPNPKGECEVTQGGAGKHPIGAKWQRSGITSPLDWDLLAEAPHPGCNVGGLTGRPSNRWVLDVDPDSGGDLKLKDLEVEYGPLPLTRTHMTGSGGMHYVFRMPADFEPTNSRGRLPKGLDVRGTGGQIVMPPSVSWKGPYVIVNAGPIVAAPAWLIDLIRPIERAAPRTGQRVATGPAAAGRLKRYAQAALKGICDDMRTCHVERNLMCRNKAADAVRLFNAPWSGLEWDDVYAAWEDAAYDHPDGIVIRPSEILGCWSRGVRHAGDEQRDLPPEHAGDTMAHVGGEGIPFSGAPSAAPPLGQAGSGSGAPAIAPEVAHLAFEHPDVAGLTLPEEFWSARSVFGQIRQAAHARTVSGDVALYSTLARLAALWPHRVRADTGVKSPASLNLYVAIVGPSGAGKSSGISVAESLVPRPPWLKAGGGEHDPFADDVPLGTGEGIAEAYMGVTAQAVPQLDGNGDPLVYATGERAGQEKTKSEKVRRQVRHNLLVHADEGESLARMLQRSGATVGESLRRAWAGATIGQQNGRTETTRIVKSGQYSLGLLIGFQRETCQELLADGAAGTPQRFLWAWATDPSIPRYRVPVPSVLAGVWRAGDGNAWLIAGERETDERPVTFDEPIRDELFELHHGLSTGSLALPELDAHMPLTKVKVAVLLAQLEGRRHVTVEDWQLAGVVWLTSCRVRDHLVAFGQAMRVKDSAAKRAAYAGQEAAAEVARHEVRTEVEARRIARVADRIAKLAGEAGPEGVPLGRLRGAKLAARDRDVFAEALDVAVARLTVIVKTIDGTERVCPL